MNNNRILKERKQTINNKICNKYMRYYKNLVEKKNT